MAEQPAAPVTIGINALAETVARLAEQVANFMDQQRERRQELVKERIVVERQNIKIGRPSQERIIHQRLNNQDYRVNADIPLFHGTNGIEEFLDWLAEVDRFFEVIEVPESKQVKIVAIRLKSVAAIWWDKQRTQRKNLFLTWKHMRQLMIDRFLPKDYEQIMQRMYNNSHRKIGATNYETDTMRLSERKEYKKTETSKDESSFITTTQDEKQLSYEVEVHIEESDPLDDMKESQHDKEEIQLTDNVEQDREALFTSAAKEGMQQIDEDEQDEELLTILLDQEEMQLFNEFEEAQKEIVVATPKIAEFREVSVVAPEIFDDIVEATQVQKFEVDDIIHLKENSRTSSFEEEENDVGAYKKIFEDCSILLWGEKSESNKSEEKKSVAEEFQFDPGGKTDTESMVKVIQEMINLSCKLKGKRIKLLQTFKDTRHLFFYIKKRTRGRVLHKWESLMHGHIGPKAQKLVLIKILTSHIDKFS